MMTEHTDQITCHFIPATTNVTNRQFVGIEDEDNALREACQGLFTKIFEHPVDPPVFAQYLFFPGPKPAAQSGTDVWMESSGKKDYAFVFLHGAGENTTSGPSAIRDNMALMSELLTTFPGYAVLPQALPYFDNVFFCPSHPDDEIVPGKNALVTQGYAQWLSSLNTPPDACFTDPSSTENKFWVDIEQSNMARIEGYVDQFRRAGISANHVYILGFSVGAVMAQHVAVHLALSGKRIGGSISFDGAPVQQIATESAFATLAKSKQGPIPALYFLYSEPALSVGFAKCLDSYQGLDVQVYRIMEEANKIPHAAYAELLPAVGAWVKKSSAEVVDKLWLSGIAKIHASLRASATTPVGAQP